MNMTFYGHSGKAFFFIFLLMVTSASCRHGSGSYDKSKPLEPEEAMASFQIAPGFKIELIAAEPLVSDPVDMEIDERGRLYVVEMHGYPLDKSGSGRVKVLSDTDGDGRMDKSTVFAEGLVLPNSIMRWKKGVIVTDAPNVLYLEDTDGDDKADLKDTLLTGFALSNPQHNVSNPVYNFDNWIYLGHEGTITTRRFEDEFGDLGGEIYFPDRPTSPRLGQNAFGRTVRFNPDSYQLETTASATQFGHTFDTWGRHLLIMYSNHIYQEVLANRYLERNPELLLSDVTQSLSDHLDLSEVHTITKTADSVQRSTAGMSSVCGITLYLGGLFDSSYKNVAFIADPVNHVVHADKLSDAGASFKASRRPQNSEFMASTDAWFSPVNHYIGPDGALYVVDMYRQIIEHPEWLGKEFGRESFDDELYNGSDRGRIWRITPKDAPAVNWTKGIDLGNAAGDQLADHLANPNIWWRIHAQRLLVDQASPAVIPKLVELAGGSVAEGRLHALWTLHGMKKLSPELIKQALKDSEPGVRENAVRLAELHLRTEAQLINELLLLQDDPDPKVRFQLLCTLGFVKTPASSLARHHILFRDIADKWSQIGALSAPLSEISSLLSVVLDKYKKEVPAYASLVERTTTMIAAAGDAPAVQALVQKAVRSSSISEKGWEVAMLEGITEGLKRNDAAGTILGSTIDLVIQTSFEHPSGQVRTASINLLRVTGIPDNNAVEAVIQRALVIANDTTQTENKRVEALNLVAIRNPAQHASALKRMIVPSERIPVQLAALKALSSIPDNTVNQYILQEWPQLLPQIKDAAVSTFLVNPGRIVLLLDAIDEGKITQVSLASMRNLRSVVYPEEKLRMRVQALFAKNDEEAEKVNHEYQDALTLKGDPAAGKQLFIQHCGLCHQVNGKLGVQLGPDLGTINSWEPKDLMANILAPNLSISSGYDLWRVEQKNGLTVQGMIASESPVALTIRNFGSMDQTINRLDIKSINALKLSTMPAGWDKQISKQQMANLLSFLLKK